MNIILIVFEKKDNERKLAAELLAGLKSCIDITDFEKAYDELIPMLSDLCCDIPKVTDYMGYFIAQGILSDFLSLSFIGPEKLIEHINPVLAESLLAQCFKTLQQKDETRLHSVYTIYADSMQKFLKDKTIERFLQANGLKVLLSDEKSKLNSDLEPKETLISETTQTRQESPIPKENDTRKDAASNLRTQPNTASPKMPRGRGKRNKI